MDAILSGSHEILSRFSLFASSLNSMNFVGSFVTNEQKERSRLANSFLLNLIYGLAKGKLFRFLSDKWLV